MNVARLVLDAIERFGPFVSTHYEGASFTNIQLLDRAERLATMLLNRGVRPGDRVIVMLPNSPDVLAAFHAVWRIGAVIVPVPPQLTANELHYLLGHSGATLALTSLKLIEVFGKPAPLPLFLVATDDVERELSAAEPLKTVHDAQPNDLALLLYTSGTTGSPKGVMLSHNNLLENAKATAKVHDVNPKTITLHVLPLSHSFGVLCMNVDAIYGSTSVILPRFDTHRVLEAIQHYRVHRMAAVPTMMNYLILSPERDKFDSSSLKFVSSGGAPLPESVRCEFEEAFECVVQPGYGLSEAAPTVSALSDDDVMRPGTSGRPIPGVEVAILDARDRFLPAGEPGEICVRGPNVMLGYWNDPEATSAVIRKGWLHTGDQGHLDSDRFLYITDRLKDIIIKGGENISPRHIEDVFLTHPAVAEAAVVGVHDAVFGEDIHAVVVLRPGQTVAEPALREYAASKLHRYKTPTRVWFREALPKNSVGKVLKRELRADLS